MQKAFSRAFRVYSAIAPMSLFFGVFVLASLLLMPLVSSYLVGGGGFIRFSSLLYDMTFIQCVLLLLVGFVSLLFLSVFVSLMMTAVKMVETLDRVGVNKILSSFQKYVTRLFTLLLFFTVLSIGAGVLLELFEVPHFITQVLLAGFWIPFIFAPQILVLEDYSASRAIADSVNFLRRSPSSFIVYLVTGLVLIFAVLCLEFALSSVFTWEHKILSSVLVSLLVLPFLQVLATELYILRYPLAHHHA